MSNTNGSGKDIRTWLSGDYNVICDVCGRKRKRSECAMAYGEGTIPVVMSCLDGCADENHPLNYPPPIIFDGRPVRDARPDQGNNKEIFIPTSFQSNYLWGKLPWVWGAFNAPNNEFNLNGIFTWGNLP